MIEHDTARQKLLALKHELEGRRERIAAHQRMPHEADSQEQAQQRENDDVVDALEPVVNAELNAVKRALTRLEAGDYGLCEKCGAAIAEERLAALPATPFCIRCAE